GVLHRREFDITEVSESTARVKQDGKHIIRAQRLDFSLRLVAAESHRIYNGVVELLNGHVLAGREVIGAVADAIDCLQHYAGQILHEYEIAARFGNEALFTVLQALIENGQRASDVSRANDVCQTEGDEIDAGQ